jgi:hypothetical protein
VSRTIPFQVSAARLLAVFGLASLTAVLTGIAICTASGVPLALGLRNLAAWVIGAAAAAALAFTPQRYTLPVFLWLLPLGLLASLFGPDLQGVHRWLPLGPVQANAAMLLGPAAIVAFAARSQAHPASSWIALLAALALTVLQPDVSHAMTLAGIALIATWFMKGPALPGLLIDAAAVIGALIAWMRPDPLAPVPEVEGVIGLAFAQSWPLGVLGLTVLLLTAAIPLVGAVSDRHRLAALALGVCLLAWSLAPFLGAFPVPFLGMGPSPILGAWLGIGLLAAHLRPQAASTAA